MSIDDAKGTQAAGSLLQVEGLTAEAGGREILHGIDLEIGKGEVHVLMGPNGAGKSTLGCTLMGDPRYRVTGGKISFKGQDITHETADRRAKEGMFLSFQTPAEVPGITLGEFLRTALEQRTGKRAKYFEFRDEAKKSMQLLNMDISYLDREFNVGFSGGEKKKAEVLQLLMLKPDLAILDETDSGLDVDAVRTVSAGIERYRETVGGSLLVITHSTRILDSLDIDRVHVMVRGKLAAAGGPSMIDEINRNGFAEYEHERRQGQHQG